MKFKTYHLFYYLTFLLVALALFTSFTEAQNAGRLVFFVASALFALLIASVYNRFQTKGRPVIRRTIIIHFVLMLIGLFYTYFLYMLILDTITVSMPDPSSASIGITPTMFVGPFFLIVSLVVFIKGLVSANKSTNIN